ncbi:MAG: c-type cytochrome, partial [Candidatus Binatia bacterium]
GKVVNDLEYREMVDFSASAEEQLARVREGLSPEAAASAAAALSELRRRIDRKGPSEAIREQTGRVIPLLIDAFALKPVPRQIPDTERAAALYRESCATCHGERGGGDGPQAGELEPPPAAFTDRERMRSAAPYVFYNAITFGIDGTAMASFRQALEEQERWDLAFHLWRFVAPETAPEAAEVSLSLRDLATRSTEELVPEVLRRSREAGVDLGPSGASDVVASLRAHPKPVSDHEERLSRVREELLRSVRMLEDGSLDEAAELVTSAYLEDFEPLEPAIDRFDARVRQRFERGLIEFRKALRAREAARARAVAGELLETVSVAERIFQDTSPGGGLGTVLVLASLGALLVGGMIVMTLRRG